MARNVALDILKLCLSFFVVILHCHLFLDINSLLYFVIVNGICRIAVPIFLVVSGYYFFYISNLKKLIKWSKRLLTLYLVWMLLYSSFWLSFSSFADNVTNLLFGYFVLWYLIGTFFAGLLVYWFKNHSFIFQLSLVLICFLIGYTMQTVGNLHLFSREIDNYLNDFKSYRNFFMMCFPFMMIGFWINKYKIERKVNINIYLILFLFLLLIFESFIHYYFISHKESLDLLVMLLLIAPAILIFTLKQNVESHGKNIATLSTSIYLIHPMVMFELAKKFDANNTIVFTLYVLFASIILGYLLTLLNKRVKYLL
ncbi:acyltransferase family protein [Acinetobacter sp. ANC 3882]|uniref:acyltransferase family protein n=1 Tax=Acinetobacter sp. ANC 3882 TaxID=2923423 RepID=UPI001F4AD988|nr:acyltransferase family protein [Acinetobacter sp. ANC 3882]MCH7315773.1 acyltransferase family protein [Acinetobacter sp. ANC 3882]